MSDALTPLQKPFLLFFPKSTKHHNLGAFRQAKIVTATGGDAAAAE